MPAGTWNMPSCWMLRTITTRTVQLLRDQNISLGSWILPAFPSCVVFSVLGPCSEECWELLAGSFTSLLGPHQPCSKHKLSPARGRFAQQHQWDTQGRKDTQHPAELGAVPRRAPTHHQPMGHPELGEHREGQEAQSPHIPPPPLPVPLLTARLLLGQLLWEPPENHFT